MRAEIQIYKELLHWSFIIAIWREVENKYEFENVCLNHKPFYLMVIIFTNAKKHNITCRQQSCLGEFCLG